MKKLLLLACFALSGAPMFAVGLTKEQREQIKIDIEKINNLHKRIFASKQSLSLPNFPTLIKKPGDLNNIYNAEFIVSAGRALNIARPQLTFSVGNARAINTLSEYIKNILSAIESEFLDPYDKVKVERDISKLVPLADKVKKFAATIK